MGWLDERAKRRAARQLGPSLHPGEVVVDFDIADIHGVGRVHLVVTNVRLFVIERGGHAQPFTLAQVVSLTEPRQRAVRIELDDGSSLTIDAARTGGLRPGFVAALHTT